MTVYGLYASHEQIPPSDLLAAVVHAEQAGFTAAMCSDHFSPWSVRQGESGFAWSWLGSAPQATGHLPFGVVNAPGQRYHPTMLQLTICVAQRAGRAARGRDRSPDPAATPLVSALVMWNQQQLPAVVASFICAELAQQALCGGDADAGVSAFTTYTSQRSLPGPWTQTLSWRA